MQPDAPTITTLTGRTVLIGPLDTQGRILSDELERHGARVITWPTIEIGEAGNHAALDEAIENLFGYDWLIFRNVNAVEFFLRRFQELEHEISELDALRVCAIGEETASTLERSQVHVDLIRDQFASDAVFAAIETYAGGRDSLRGLNFLIPCAAIARQNLQQALEDAGARVDVVNAYRTVALTNQALSQLNALLAGGGVDCIAFTNASDVRQFAQLLDTNDLVRIFAGVVVACIDESTEQSIGFGLRATITPSEFTITALAEAIAFHFAR
jgi:uroporphyrinogen III methyltransferase/synthase